MKPLPKRSDAIYTEVESFEEYELTQCIAYEMAMRNKYVRETIKNYSSYPIYFPEDEREEPYTDTSKDLLEQKL